MNCRIGALLILIVLNGCGFAPYNTSVYEGLAPENNNLKSKGEIKYSNGDSYQGNLKKGYPHGKGKLRFKNGNVYRGEFRDGRMHGSGEMKYADGSVFTGQFRGDKPKGEGIWKLSSGDVNKGEFDDLERFEGEKITNKGTYVGKFKHGDPEGEVIFRMAGEKKDRFQVWEDGVLIYDVPGPSSIEAASNRCGLINDEWAIIQGSCSEEIPYEDGLAVSKDFIKVAKGKFDGGELTEGRMSVREGHKYEGEFRNYLPHGKVKYFKDGIKVYDGEFVNGWRHGKGICLPGGKPERCEFFMGRRADTGHLSRLIKIEMGELKKGHAQELTKIKMKTRQKEKQWTKDYRRQMAYIQDEIDSAEKGTFGKSLTTATLMIMNNDEAGAKRYTNQQYQDLRERKEDLRQMERQFNQKQAEAKERFAQEQREKIYDITKSYQDEISKILKQHRHYCESVLNRSWVESDNLCVKNNELDEEGYANVNGLAAAFVADDVESRLKKGGVRHAGMTNFHEERVMKKDEYLPIFSVRPIYPRRAQSREIEGYCKVEFTVTKKGTTKDITPVDCSPAGYFERASVKAAEKLKYNPRMAGGQPVEVSGVHRQYEFKLDNRGI